MNKIMAAGATCAIAMALIIAIPQAHAEYPNILAGQDLTVGASNQNVVVLQGLLSEMGYLNVPAGIPFGYYGALTRNAVAAYQSHVNVSPTLGYYGPLTKVAMYSDFAAKGWLKKLGWE